jgi:peptide/nickel transport system substrate-binding protein
VNTKTGKPIGNGNPAVLDPKFRFALNFAIDRADLARKVYQGGASPAVTIIPPAYRDYLWSPPSSDAPRYDPQKADRLLDEAGYKVGKDGWRTLPNGKPIGTLRLAARSEEEASLGTMNFLKEWLNGIHIKSKVVPMESGKLTTTILAGDYDLFQWDWFVEPDPDSILSVFTCAQRNASSDSWYCNKAYDKLYAEQHAELNRAKRIAIIKQMEQILYDDAPYVVTVYTKIGEAYRSDRFHGFVPQPNPGGIFLMQYGAYNYVHLQPGSASASTSGAGSSAATSHTGVVIGSLVGGVLLFAAGGLFGGWVGYRRASVDFRE